MMALNPLQEEFTKLSDEIVLDLTAEMGRYVPSKDMTSSSCQYTHFSTDCPAYSPIAQNGGEVRGTLERARYMISIAKESLKDVELKETDKPGFRRRIKRVPLGVVLVIAPWK